MLSQQEITEINETLSKIDNDSLKKVIARIHWTDTTDATYWQTQLEGDYSPQMVKDILNFLWQEVTRRGISVSEVQSEIYKIAQQSVEQNRADIKADADFQALVLKRGRQKQAGVIVRNIVIAIVIITALFLLYKYVLKGKLKFA